MGAIAPSDFEKDLFSPIDLGLLIFSQAKLHLSMFLYNIITIVENFA